MGNYLETFTSDDPLRIQVEGSMVVPAVTRARIPNEIQYGPEAAYGLIAYKNQNPEANSDLDQARLNFENKYQAFLNWYGQYSNVVIKDSKGEPITYPVNHFFSRYEWLKPTR